MSLAGIRALSFDADGTLWDFQKVMRHSLALALEELRRQVGGDAGDLDVDRLIQIRDEVAASAQGSRMESVRLEAFRQTVRQIGHPDDELARRLCSLYLHHRFHDIELYEDAAPALEALRGRYRLGLLTNGNSYPDRCGLSGVFDFVVLAQDHGFSKPDPRLFGVAAERAGCRADELLQVGDSWENDVLGATGAALKAVWLNRGNRPRPEGAPGVPTIASLASLPGLLAG